MFPVVWLTAYVHNRIDEYAVILNAIIDPKRKAIDKMATNIFLNDLPGFWICQDILDTCFNALTKDSANCGLMFA